MEKGEWQLADYKCELAKTINQKERTAILIEKEKLKKREIELQIAEVDQRIMEIQNENSTLDKTIAWCKKMIETKEKEQIGN